MRHKTNLLAILLLTVAGVSTVSCEKHNGKSYFKQNCTAELNGRSYIDQTPLEYIMSPLATVTPYLEPDEHRDYLHFHTALARKRGAAKEYFIDIYLYAKNTEELIGETILFKRESRPEGSATDFNSPLYSDYYRWLIENAHNFAVINKGCDTEYAEIGKFNLYSCNEENRLCTGSFSLFFSEGTLTGAFEVVNPTCHK